jgi:Ring finger domain
MTIPAPFNWCPNCNEACHDHPTMCTVCGTTLTSPPPQTSTSSISNNNNNVRVRIIPETVTNAIRQQSSNEIRNLLSSLNTRMDIIRMEQNELRQQLEIRMPVNMNEILDDFVFDRDALMLSLNDTTNNNQSTGTATNVLDALPRIQYTTDCTLFQQCVVEFDIGNSRNDNNDTESITTNINDTNNNNRFTKTHLSSSLSILSKQGTKLSIPAIPGEFCKWPNRMDSTNSNSSNNNNNNNNNNQQQQQQQTVQQTLHRCYMSNLTLVVADLPGTGENGILSKNTIDTIQTIVQKQRSRVILYMNRGGKGGITFVQKAKLAQQYGATVCIIGNHLPNGPWPYTMCDSTNEANTLQLQIPTIMISYEHGQLVQQLYFQQQRKQNNTNYITGTITLQSKHEMECCCICTDSYIINSTILQIKPGCEHYFHESCALQWLQQHNTCPYCRYTLPFADVERERYRIVQQQQQQSTNQANLSNDYYG